MLTLSVITYYYNTGRYNKIKNIYVEYNLISAISMTPCFSYYMQFKRYQNNTVHIILCITQTQDFVL